ncbi:MAG: sporulation protein [Lachnospiraceae bacterium]|nr:sporulation protein [Lachnospiraceae bacterium]MBR6274253.1 sporulation protein [Lachnospiraceae bacterium]
MANEKFDEMFKSLFGNMKGFLSSETVVGKAMTLPNGTILIPIMDVTFGVGGGGFTKKHTNGGTDDKNKTSGAIGGKMSANCVIIIEGDEIRVLNIKQQDALTRCIDLIPEISKRIKKLKNGDNLDEVVDQVAREAVDAQANNK